VDELDYPRTEDLNALAHFKGTPRGFFAVVRDLWSDPARVREVPVADSIGSSAFEVTLVTGGWSGNESVAEVVCDSFAHVLWWRSSERGGLSVYRVPASLYDMTFDLSVLADPARDAKVSELLAWKANAEVTLAQDKLVMDRDADTLARTRRSVAAWQAIAATAPASALPAQSADAIGDMAFDLRAILGPAT
jgi:hypothetical protein